ncbi:MAG: polysaccharide deacetylase family protein [Clostridia bacterium]|nr:polysaccharide deacetylase family protein [Clostridia bacterium]
MKLIGIGKKKTGLFILLALWLAVLVAVIVLTAVKTVSATPRKIPVYAVGTSEKKIALTFNAAWGDETTDGILDILRENGVKATFFFVGDFVGQYPESVKKIVNAGHEAGNHSDKHGDPTRQTFAQITADISACNDKIFALTGIKPVLYRAPSGAYDNNTVEAAESLGMTAIQWSADSIDWKNITPAKMQARILEKVYPGAILLFHLGKENTLQALPGILNSLLADGYEICTVGELLLDGETYVDHNGVQRQAGTQLAQ